MAVTHTSFFGGSFFDGGFFAAGVEDAVATVPVTGGGIPQDGSLYGRGAYDRTRTSEEISEERKKFGVIDELAAKAIADVAARQAEAKQQDEQKRFEELTRELKLRGIKWDKRYLDALKVERERVIALQIAQQQDDDAVIIMLIAASL